ncbi:MAG: 5'-nucleotidase C-terminal domain-containing protein [Blastocatellia bacterium]|nr:5'-nucleotidase C-terminal domain-containing protein [Blastocatellia bacterium]MCS7157299.1 5'-nucleotidase C-terminal domain-containing protein [Blastocatellia bacterium]MCX7752025.1 5'-nucleotidase C-terminal domain-containing protein [Blastocatellia bacterium]MDW8167130.1 5'-nucleotidase [Acidobacteriota bacterium]
MSEITRRKRWSLAATLLLLVGGWSAFAQAPQPPTADIRIKPAPIRVDASAGEDKTVKDLVARYGERLRAEMRTVIGRADQDLIKGLGGGSLGAFVADVIRRTAEQITGEPIHAALQNSGGLRRPIPRGKITLGTIYEVMPFENQIVVLEISGETLLALIRHLVARGNERVTDALSGVHIVACRGELKTASVDGRPIEPHAIYRLATSDYLHQGGGGYAMLATARTVIPTGMTIRDALINFIRHEAASGRAIAASAEERFRVECPER